MTQDELKNAIHSALRNWTAQSGDLQSYLEDLLLVRKKREKIQGSSPTAYRLAANQVLHDGVEALRVQDEVSAALLLARFMDGEKLQSIAYKQHMSLDQVKRRQRNAIENLTQIIWNQETAVRQENANYLKNQLVSASYTQLFGLQEQLDDLVQHILNDLNLHIFAIVGIGGIGKTALADAVVREVIDHFTFEQAIWLRIDKSDETQSPELAWQKFVLALAEQCRLDLSSASSFPDKESQLKQFLKLLPLFVVIDNLESEKETALIAQRLENLSKPSKFLLTTRTRLPETSTAWTVALKELSMPDSFQLVKSHANSLGLTELAQADDDTLMPLFETIGGNPLALKLVVGLAHVMSLPEILSGLITVNHQEIATMYKYIYAKSWSLLSENARHLLEMMPMASSTGMLPEQMRVISELNEQDLWGAITELANRSLLEVQGTIWERRYGIHRLTEAFLQTEIIHWPEEMD